MKLSCFICLLLCSVSAAQAAPSPPNLMPIRGNVWTTNVPPVRLTNAQELLQTDILTVAVPGGATNDWGHAGITQLIRGSVLMPSMAGTNASLAGFDTNGYLGKASASFSDGTNTTVVQLGPFTPLRIPVADGTNTLTDGPLSIPSVGSTNVTFDGQIFFRSGNSVSNSFGREADTLVYTNDSLSATVGPGFMVRDRNGRFASLRALGTTAEVAGSNSVSLNATLTQVQLNGSLVVPSFTPLNDGVSLGSATSSTGRPWGDIIGRGVIYNYGFPLTGADIADIGDYARMAITHTGTNGVILSDSQSSGTAGEARPFTWATNGVLIAKLQQNEFLLTNSATSTVGSMRISSGGHTLLLAGTGGDLFFGVNNSGSGNLALTSNGLVPVTDGGLGLGSGANGFSSITLDGITKAQKTALTPSDGMIVYQTDNTPGLRAYVNGAWVMVSTVADP